MIKILRQYRSDARGLPGLEEDVMDDDLPGLNIKKKESSGSILGGGLSSAGSGLQGGFGSDIKEDQKQKIKDFMYGLKTQDEKKLAQPSTTNLLQAGKKPKPVDIDKEAQKVIENMDEARGVQDPLKEIYSQAKDIKDLPATNRAAEILKDRLFSSGIQAKEMLANTHFGLSGDDNVTSRVLRERADKYDKSISPIINRLGSEILSDSTVDKYTPETLDFVFKDKITNAAVDWYADKNPQFKSELEAVKNSSSPGIDYRFIIPSSKIGQIVNQFMNDDDIIDFVSIEHPNLLAGFKRVRDNNMFDNIDYGINQVANKVSREVQARGFNDTDPIINFYGEAHKKYANTVANLVLTPEELSIWNAHIKDNQEQYMDAPSLLQGLAEAGGNVFKGAANTITEPFTSDRKSIMDQWEKESSNVSADPKGISKFLRDVGHAGGTVMGIGALGSVGGGGAAANAGATATAFLGDELEFAKREFPNQPIKQWTSAILKTAGYTALGSEIFPVAKVKAAFGEVKPQLNKVIANLANGEITRDVAKKEATNIFKKVIDIAGKGIEHNTKMAAGITAVDKFGRVIDDLMGADKQFTTADDLDRFKSTWLSFAPIAGLSAFGQVRTKNKIVEESLYEAATNPKRFERVLDELQVKDPSANVTEMKDNLKYLSDLKQTLDAGGVPVDRQKRFMLNAMQERAKAATIKDKANDAVTRKTKEEIKEHQEIQEKILKHEENIVTDKEQKAIDESEEAKVEIERLTKENELDNKELSAQRKELDGRDPANKIKIERLEEKIRQKNEDFEKKVSEAKEKVIEEPIVEKPTDLKSTSVIMPDENKVAENVPLAEKKGAAVILPEENKVPENIPLKKSNEEVVPENTESNQHVPAEEKSATEEPATEATLPTTKTQEAVDDLPFGRSEVSGIKNAISEVKRYERALPKVELPKIGTDIQRLEEGKRLVDSGEVNPREVTSKIIAGDGKIGMHPDEAQAMQYYMHQLNVAETDLRKRISSLDEGADKSELEGQLYQLSDETDSATRANELSGTAWSSVGNTRQMIVDIGFNPYREKSIIKDAYGGEVPKDVQLRLDTALKERDEALSKLEKLQTDQTKKQADEAVRKAGTKNPKKNSEDFKKERTEIKQSISGKLKGIRTGESGLSSIPLPFAREIIEITPDLWKLVKSYAEEGVLKTEEVINRLHDILKDDIEDIQKSDIVNFLAGKYKEEARKLLPSEQRLRDYKVEANLWTKIAAATKMEETTPAKQKEKNDKIRMLRDRLNEIRQKNRESVKSIQDIISTDAQKEVKKLEQQRKGLETQLKTRKFLESKEKKYVPLNTEIVRQQQMIAKAQYKIRNIKREAFNSRKNFYQRGLMWAGKLFRASVLSGYNVLYKLASAATIGGAAKRIPEQAIGSVYNQIFRGIAEKAPIEGFTNANSEARFYKEFFNPKKFIKNTWQILKGNESYLTQKHSDAQYGKSGKVPLPEKTPAVIKKTASIVGQGLERLISLPTDLHQVLKDPVKRATFESSFKNGMIWAERNGLDINDPLVINTLETAAYKRANYEIFMEQNWLSRKFSDFKSKMEKSGNIGATGKFVADFLIPVSTVPTNIVRRLVTTSPAGLMRGGAKVVEAYRKGIENLKPDEADAIMKQLKQGSLGTALWLIGWFGAANFGGLYSKYNPNKQRDEGDLASDEMEVNGQMIPKPVQHALPFEIIQWAATARHIFDNYKEHKDASTFESLYRAGMGSIGAVAEHIPVVETGTHVLGAFENPYEAEKLKEDATRRFEPQILRETGIIPKKEKSVQPSSKRPTKDKKQTKPSY